MIPKTYSQLLSGDCDAKPEYLNDRKVRLLTVRGADVGNRGKIDRIAAIR